MGTNSFVNLPTIGVGYAATVLATTPSQLASFITAGPITEGGYNDGQLAYVESSGLTYVLRPAVGTPDGVLVIATSDDVSRQWVATNTTDIIAEWPVGITRVYAIDGINGNDANKGYADPATNSTADYAIACQAAGAVALKTVAGLAAILPRLGADRTVEVVYANGGVNTNLTYAADVATFLNGCVGYLAIAVRATGTNTTANCTAFDGSVADCVYVGAQTAPGFNAPGYNPTGVPTTTTIQCLTAAGGAPGFTPEASMASIGWRIRFSANTATAALRNVVGFISKISGTDTIVLPAALPAVPTSADIFYVEQAAVTFSGATINLGSDGTIIQLAGIQTATTFNFRDTRVQMSLVQSGTSMTFTDCLTLSLLSSYSHPVRGTVSAGGSRVGTTATFTRSVPSANTFAVVTTMNVNNCQSATFAVGFVMGTNMTLNTCQGVTIGGTGVVVSIPPRIVGLGVINLTSSVLNCGQVEVNGAAMFAILGYNSHLNLGFAGTNALFVFPIDGSTKGFFTVGMNNGGIPAGILATRTLVSFNPSNPPPTGFFADVLMLAGGIARTWAQCAVGVTDGSSNQVIAGNNSPVSQTLKYTGILFGAAGATTNYLSDSGNALAANNPTPWQYPVARNMVARSVTAKASSNTMVNAVTVDVRKNNVSQGTISIPAGSTSIVTGLIFSDYIYGTDTLDVVLLGAAGEGGHQIQLSVMVGTS